MISFVKYVSHILCNRHKAFHPIYIFLMSKSIGHSMNKYDFRCEVSQSFGFYKNDLLVG